MLTAEIQHFLRFANAAHVGTGQTMAAGDKRSSADRNLLLWNANQNHAAVDFQKPQILVPIYIRGNCIDDQVEYPASFWNVSGLEVA